MPDADAGGEILSLREDFPPVPTAAWEAAIAKDLKGADYDKKLVWRTEPGLALRPYYRQEALATLGDQLLSRHTGRGWEIAQDADPRPQAIRADLLHEAGAHAVQELGYAMAAAVERLASDPSVPEIGFVFAAGPSYFIEIAKFRAARILWTQVVHAFGGPAVRIHLAVVTPRRNKSTYDRYTNLLRATTEAMSAVIGGCDRLTVEPFGFDSHLAENLQRILQEESHLDAVADPAGGSYFIEALTDSLAREAWGLLQDVESAGGYAAVVASGAIDKALAETRAARAKAYSSRRQSLVGVNNYPNLMEKTPGAETPDGSLRIAEPFEAIRRRTNEHAKTTGRYAKVLLLTCGDVKMRGARANFSLNFLGCAGFDIVESEEYDGSDADLIVLCSSDPEYLAFALDVCPRVKVPVIVAGNPKDQIEALQVAGVQGFIHVQSDILKTLTEWQDKLGMRRAQ
ncbi:MAG TPA: methylmalonyl-CoA mutase family protein [Bryobacteraceae bacterium]|nr:methylmalonyl-CoA mutase family protein [Bryobacteraceae bacterium]